MCSGYNLVDVVSVTLSLIALGPLDVNFAVLRLIRACRVVRLFGRFKSIRGIISALAASIVPVINAFVIMFLIVAICGALAVRPPPPRPLSFPTSFARFPVPAYHKESSLLYCQSRFPMLRLVPPPFSPRMQTPSWGDVLIQGCVIWSSAEWHLVISFLIPPSPPSVLHGRRHRGGDVLLRCCAGGVRALRAGLPPALRHDQVRPSACARAPCKARAHSCAWGRTPLLYLCHHCAEFETW